MIDLDALAAEANATPKEFRLGGTTFTMPAELPGSVLAPFLAEDLGLLDVLADAMNVADDDTGMGTLLFRALEARPNLPAGLLAACSKALANLLGDQYDTFLSKQPSVPAYINLAKGLFSEYGMSFGDFFGSASSSDSGGESSNLTSPTTTPEPTSEASSVAPQEATPAPAPVIPETPASSESAG